MYAFLFQWTYMKKISDSICNARLTYPTCEHYEHDEEDFKLDIVMCVYLSKLWTAMKKI